MEGLLKRRSPVRATFTKSYNALITALTDKSLSREDLEIKLSSLERIARVLADLDDKICNLLIDGKSENYDEEYEKIEEYRGKLDIARVRTKVSLEKLFSSEEPVSDNVEKATLKLPKIELVKFGGDVKDWLSFWSQFSRIHVNNDIVEEDKFQYLIQSTIVGSRARDIIDSYPPTSQNYAKAVESLKSRFGREELLVEYYVRELLALVVNNATNIKSKLNITQLYDKLESHLRALESIGVTSEKYAAMLLPLVESCIPETLLRIWLRNTETNKEKSVNYSGDKLSELLSFLRAEVEGEERISLAKSGFKSDEILNRNKRYKDTETSVPTANDLVYESKPWKYCIFCGKGHKSQDCFKGQKMGLEEKKEIIRKNKACFACLKVGHYSNKCKSNVQCINCRKKHWPILCPEMTEIAKTNIEENPDKEEIVMLSNQSQPEVLLQTLLVVIKAGGKCKTVRALFDTGSQRSYILKSTIGQMNAIASRSENLTHVVFGGASSLKHHKCYNLSVSSLRKNYSSNIDVLDQQVICGYIPSIRRGVWSQELQNKGIELTDMDKSTLPIELLIGADYAGKFFTGNIHHLPSGLAAVETYLGWCIMGKSNADFDKFSTSLLVQSENISDLWKLEAIGIMDPCETENSKEMESVAFNYFSKNVRVDQEGRYRIKLPWMRSLDELPSNRDTAEKRLMSNSVRLLKNDQFECYDSVFEEWKKDGIIEESCEGPGHYLPHRGVFKANSTTKVRPVFDASCKSRGQLSLNDCLMKGPNMIEIIPSIILRFREKKFGVISDIKKAFLQISVAEEDRKYLKFLWWKNKDRTSNQVYQHARVVFGLTCSPFLLSAVIHHHLNQYLSTPLRDTVVKLKDSFYVDNCVTSVNSEPELHQFIKVATELMAEAKFDLRGWEFAGERALHENLKPTLVLGLLWEKSEDGLFCDNLCVAAPPEIITRRVILSYANRVFDLIGFTCPVTLRPKILLQDIPTVGVPDLDKLDKTDIKKRGRHQQSLRQQLRYRFRREYLGTLLQSRPKSNLYEVKIGDIVLIEYDSKKRLLWPMAKVLEFYPGKDGTVRVVRLKTSNSEVVRPVRRIYPLEIRSTDGEYLSGERTVTIRSGRIVKVPSRFMNT